ncbi:MAG: hypothetical protein HY080_16895 [Gammaproteobacteria bacterium]|nr:hypothetical protein [Gammaproteobacteria bacterium]
MSLFLLSLAASMVFFIWLVIAAFTRSIVWGLIVLIFSPFAALAFGVAYFRDVKLPLLLYIVALVLSVVTFISTIPSYWVGVCAHTANPMCGILGLATASADSKNKSPVHPLLAAPSVVPTLPATLPAVTPPPLTPPPLSAQPPVATPPPTVTPLPAVTAPEAAKTEPANTTKPGNASNMANFPAKNSDAPIDPLQVKRPEPPKNTETIKPGRVGKYLKRYLIVTLTNNTERRGILKKVNDNTLLLERHWIAGGSESFTLDRARIKKIQVLKETPKDEK